MAVPFPTPSGYRAFSATIAIRQGLRDFQRSFGVLVRCPGAALTNARWNLFRSRHGVLLTVLLITLVSCVLFGICALPFLVELPQLWAFTRLMDFRSPLVPAALANAIVRRNWWWFARHHDFLSPVRNEADCLEFPVQEAAGPTGSCSKPLLHFGYQLAIGRLNGNLPIVREVPFRQSEYTSVPSAN
jgi:hypothetical protein